MSATYLPNSRDMNLFQFGYRSVTGVSIRLREEASIHCDECGSKLKIGWRENPEAVVHFDEGVVEFSRRERWPGVLPWWWGCLFVSEEILSSMNDHCIRDWRAIALENVEFEWGVSKRWAKKLRLAMPRYHLVEILGQVDVDLERILVSKNQSICRACRQFFWTGDTDDRSLAPSETVVLRDSWNEDDLCRTANVRVGSIFCSERWREMVCGEALAFYEVKWQ